MKNLKPPGIRLLQGFMPARFVQRPLRLPIAHRTKVS